MRVPVSSWVTHLSNPSPHAAVPVLGLPSERFHQGNARRPLQSSFKILKHCHPSHMLVGGSIVTQVLDIFPLKSCLSTKTPGHKQLGSNIRVCHKSGMVHLHISKSSPVQTSPQFRVNQIKPVESLPWIPLEPPPAQTKGWKHRDFMFKSCLSRDLRISKCKCMRMVYNYIDILFCHKKELSYNNSVSPRKNGDLMHFIPGFSHLQNIDCLSIYSIISIETPSLQAWTKLILAVVVSQTKCIEDANSLLACCWFKNNDQQLQAGIIIYKRIHELLMFPPKRKENDAQSPTISFFVPSNIEGMLQQMERRKRPWKNHKWWPPAARTSATVAPSVPPSGGELVCQRKVMGLGLEAQLLPPTKKKCCFVEFWHSNLGFWLADRAFGDFVFGRSHRILRSYWRYSGTMP